MGKTIIIISEYSRLANPPTTPYVLQDYTIVSNGRSNSSSSNGRDDDKQNQSNNNNNNNNKNNNNNDDDDDDERIFNVKRND
jgi:hypothetical protein